MPKILLIQAIRLAVCILLGLLAKMIWNDTPISGFINVAVDTLMVFLVIAIAIQTLLISYLAWCVRFHDHGEVGDA